MIPKPLTQNVSCSQFRGSASHLRLVKLEAGGEKPPAILMNNFLQIVSTLKVLYIIKSTEQQRFYAI